MSKKLDTIIKRVPPAISQDEDVFKTEPYIPEERVERIVAVVPSSLKRQIKQYIVDRPGETEKTVLLKALLALGFSIDSKFLKDNRGRK